MKRIICAFLAVLLCLTMVSCGSSDDHEGEAKTPSGSSVMQGRNYQDVIETFEEKGFTNIKAERIEDLVFGLLTEDGEVEKVSVGGDENYSPDKWVPADIEVIIYYHTFPTDEGSTSSETTSTDKTDADNEAEKVSKGKIVMPYSSADYCGEEWTLEELTEHLTELGFTNIVARPCDPDDDNYKINIRELYIETGLFSTDPWEAGEEYNADAEITIYYNEFPLLTVENCPDLVTVLTSKGMSYVSFADSYDGRYVEFDAYVTNHITYDGGTSHIIEVTGGDYDGVSKIDPYDENCFDGLNIRIGEAWGSSINKGVEAGDHVRVSGRIDASQSEYFKMLYVKTMSLERR